jgi:hypothetical protein
MFVVSSGSPMLNRLGFASVAARAILQRLVSVYELRRS